MVLLVIKSAKRVAEAGLCVGCGVCMSICPFDAVNMVKDDTLGIYKPVVSEKCEECGLCVETCFGIGIDPKLGSDIFKKGSKDPLLGVCLNCYAGCACNSDIRFNSASGGIVTALLLYALEEKMVNGVLVTKMDENKALEPKPFIAKTRSEVTSAARSKYCPVPADVALKVIMQEEGHYAVVGLPCHIYGIRKAESIYPDLADKIRFHIGILCGGTQSFLATEYLLRRHKVRREEIRRIEYRGEGWPGKMLIEGIRDDKLLLPYPEYWEAFGSLFLPYGCTLCADGFNRFADISCGDAWLPEYQGDNLGTSLIITRNKIGEQLMSGAYEKRAIQIKKVECARMMQAQKSMIRFKTRNLRTRFQLMKTLGRPLPFYSNKNVETPPPTLTNYVHCALFYLLRLIASKRHMWNLLDAYHALRQYVPQVRARSLYVSRLRHQRDHNDCQRAF